MSRENVATLRRGFELWRIAAGDPDEATWRAAMAEMLAGYHPEAVLDFSNTVPDYPSDDAVEAMTAWVESARGTFTELSIESTEIIDAGDAVAASMHITGKGVLSGIELDADYFYVFRFREGRIIAATTYLTRGEALKAVGLAD
jgi:ketosteroid isomerase-like protein